MLRLEGALEPKRLSSSEVERLKEMTHYWLIDLLHQYLQVNLTRRNKISGSREGRPCLRQMAEQREAWAAASFVLCESWSTLFLSLTGQRREGENLERVFLLE